jgi:hypothetical protein
MAEALVSWSRLPSADGCAERVGRTPKKAEDTTTRKAYRRIVILYAVVSDEIHQVIEFFNSPAEAEAMLEKVLKDEPDWRETLYIECVELVSGGLN